MEPAFDPAGPLATTPGGSRPERIVELAPHPPPAVPRPRVVGPGRKERAYQARVASLEAELDTAALCERGAARRMDRLEEGLERAALEAEELRRLERRLLVLAGALGAENAALRARLGLPPREIPALR